MRAAVIERYGEAPVLREVPDPEPAEGLILVEVRAAGLNPVDLRIASGRFYAGSPPVPYVPGSEGVGLVQAGGRLEPGSRVYFEARPGQGSFAQKSVAQDSAAIELPPGVDDGTAVALGVSGLAAWLGLERGGLKAGETVLVLGASGVLGLIAVQAARIMGAKRVVAAGRDRGRLEQARERGADAIVELGHAEELTEAFRKASGGGVDVVIDPVWGEPAAAAVEALNRFGRLVQIGQSAGAEATLTSSSIRGRSLAILGYTTYAVPQEQKAAAYRRLVQEAAAGRIVVESEAVPLEKIQDAWSRQPRSPHRKLVLVP